MEDLKEKFFSLQDIIDEANRCMQCQVPQCVKGCPAHINIPAYIAKIRELKFVDAYKIIIDNNLLPELTCRLCYKDNQCEGHCVLNKQKKGIKISELEKFVSDYAIENQLIDEINDISDTKKANVAIVGAGVTGLSAAILLAKAGCKVTIYEKEADIGGIVRYEIPSLRFDKSILDIVKSEIKKLKIDVINSTVIGKDLKFIDINHENDYVILASGAGRPHILGIDGEVEVLKNPLNIREKNFLYSSDFLREFNSSNVSFNGKIVVVGGGNTALDCARTVKNNFNDVSIYYRRTEDKMPARKDELEDTKKANVQFVFNVVPIAIRYENSELIVTFIKTKLEKDEYLNEKVVLIKGTEYEEKIDHLIVATGYEANHSIYSKEIPNLTVNKNNNIEVNENFMVSENENLYAAGDVVLGSSTIVECIKMGMDAAKKILQDIG